MLTLWRKNMVENKNTASASENTEAGTHCDCECCQCKKIFMMLVVLILVFMAGIMVGNCGRCHYSEHNAYNPQIAAQKPLPKPKKFHRGMQPLPATAPQNEPESYGGFIVEVE
jgi:hypothetical protein